MEVDTEDNACSVAIPGDPVLDSEPTKSDAACEIADWLVTPSTGLAVLDGACTCESEKGNVDPRIYSCVSDPSHH